jgi:UDP-glucuronate decarboxylase
VKELTGSRSELVHQPLPQDDPRQRQPDIAEAKRCLGWEPNPSLTFSGPKSTQVIDCLFGLEKFVL